MEFPACFPSLQTVCFQGKNIRRKVSAFSSGDLPLKWKNGSRTCVSRTRASATAFGGSSEGAEPGFTQRPVDLGFGTRHHGGPGNDLCDRGGWHRLRAPAVPVAGGAGRPRASGGQPDGGDCLDAHPVWDRGRVVRADREDDGAFGSAARPQPDLVVTGHQWWWEARYTGSGAVVANEFYIPAGKPFFHKTGVERRVA